jgi:hypothetical protein
MRYRKIPFVSSTTMSGLAPMVVKPRGMRGFGPQYPNSSMLGHISLSKFFGEESANNDNGLINDLDPLFRNNERGPYSLSGLGDALPAGRSVTVMLRPQPKSPGGFPGFFAWLKAEQPDMWNYAKAALPAYTTQTEGHRTGGATLMGAYLGAYMAGIENWLEEQPTRGGAYNPQEFSGLGDDTASTDFISPSLTDVISVPMPSVNIPDSSVETANTSTPPNPGPGAIAQIVSTLAQAAPQILSTVNQQTLFNTQLARAKAGLAPLNTASYGISSALSGSMLPIGIGVAAIAAFLLLRKRRG